MRLFVQESEQLYFISHYSVTWLRALYLSNAVVHYCQRYHLERLQAPCVTTNAACLNGLNSQPTKITNQRCVISGLRRGVIEIFALLERRVKISNNQPTNQPRISKEEAKDEKSQSEHNFYPRTNQLHVSATHTHIYIYI